MEKILIGSDHAGFAMKEKIKKYLEGQYEFSDLGTYSEDSVDYPDYAKKVARQVAVSPGARGILICGSGIGVCITANKIKGIRAALCYSKKAAQLSRLHNDANIVCTAGREETMDPPEEIIKTFLETDFSGEDRHKKRINKIES